MVPSLAARRFGCRAVRAVCVRDDEAPHPARILEVFGPDRSGPLLARRMIAAAGDGGRWVFETTGEPLERRKAERFTPEPLYAYLRRLEVPLDAEPDWASARLVELDSRVAGAM
jgi:hypothetical protein